MSNPKNDRCRLAYQAHLRHAKGLSEKSMDAALSALTEFEVFTRHRDFRLLHREQIIGFKDHLMSRASRADGQPLSASTIIHTLGHCRAFFSWLVEQRGYRSMNATEADYFAPPRREVMLARTLPPKPVPTPDEVRRILSTMPGETLRARRDRAIVAFMYLTGIRVNAVASLRLKHLDMVSRTVFQDAGVVRVKFSKSQVTSFFPVGSDIEQIVADWAPELRQCGYSPDDPLFPRNGELGSNSDSEIARECWSNSAPIRRIFKRAFEDAGISYYTPHAFRKTLTRLALEMCYTVEEHWAWSLNLGHNSLNTTLQHYGVPSDERRRHVLGALGRSIDETMDEGTAAFLSLFRTNPALAQAARIFARQERSSE